jgi:3-oxoacyl-[acyl-carrier protein] reductase
VQSVIETSTGILAGEVAIVTGASRGIGAAIARRMALEGATVAAWDVAPAGEGAYGEASGRISAFTCNVADPASVAEALRETEAALGPVTSLVNNAGVTRDHLLRDMTVDEWDSVMSVNLRGPFNTTKAVSVGMVERRGGTIVNISSLGGKVGTIGQTNYCASKAGLVGFTKAAAKELARFSIRVNAIQPGLVDTPMTQKLRPEIYQAKLKEVPLGRAGTPDEIGWGCVYLASAMSSYITGIVLEIGGGRYI